ncbi:hypothetical protein OOK27_49170 [Streptomyces canus]|uniref:hypothetical protein n=1 Tax=Streptomyces canus TaxID=58343 RepID=UPI00225C1C32|nr:hypothetical protein [Streptomyces canus]MCX5256698.1 hypothetical protein [Streptomyces canus]MCX5261826.1 hypothetical protein [Streptomyces canus]MCX5262013.1 hypothetical protein [Streptomyces canus]
MAQSGHASGTICVRPVRVGMVLQPDAEALSSAVQACTCVWGGKYYPWLAPDAPDLLRTAEALAVDVFCPVAGDSAAREVADQVGYRWKPDHGTPFGSHEPLAAPGVLGVEWLLDNPAPQHAFVLPEWDAADPLGPLFEVWFGWYGDYPAAAELRSRFARVAESCTIGVDAPVPAFDGLITPIGLTRLDMEYRSDDSTSMIVLVDAEDAADLMLLWTTRAAGHHVLPWPTRHAGRVRTVAEKWLRAALRENVLGRSVRGDGHDLGPTINVITRHQHVPEDLAALLQDLGITALPDSSVTHALPRHGRHPFLTASVKEFSVPLAPQQRTLALPMPQVGPTRWRPDRHYAGIVAAHVTFTDVRAAHPDWKPLVPNLRSLSTLLDTQPANLPEPFHRPARGGRVCGVLADSGTDEVRLRLLDNAAILEGLFRDTAWQPRQEANGRKVTGLAERLGGISSAAGCEPAVWQVLHTASKSADGLVHNHLVGLANKHRGYWPGPVSTPGGRASYAPKVVLALQQRGLLEPVAPLHCPECGGSTTVPAPRLEADMACSHCGRRFPLGYLLGSSPRRFDWQFRLADGITRNLMAETRPVMAAATVLACYHQQLFPVGLLPAASGTTMTCQLGVSFQFPGGPREVDLVVVLDDGPQPVVVVGEVKGGLSAQQGDLINQDDLDVLTTIQNRLREQGVECYVLAAVLRDHLEPSERDALQGLCTHPPITLNDHQGFVHPVLPIVLTGADLTQPQFSDGHLHWWSRHGLPGLAQESCRRNLYDPRI